MKNGNEEKIWNWIFIIYITLLFLLIVVKIQGSYNELLDRVETIKWGRQRGVWNYNLRPFITIQYQLENIQESWALRNIMGNFAVFIPYGFLLPLLFPRTDRFRAILFISLITTILIEIFQFVTMLGWADVDDILLNVTGSIFGYLIYKIYCCFLSRK